MSNAVEYDTLGIPSLTVMPIVHVVNSVVIPGIFRTATQVTIFRMLIAETGKKPSFAILFKSSSFLSIFHPVLSSFLSIWRTG